MEKHKFCGDSCFMFLAIDEVAALFEKILGFLFLYFTHICFVAVGGLKPPCWMTWSFCLHFRFDFSFIGFLKGGCPRGGVTGEPLRIPREDWGTLGNIREDQGKSPPRTLKNPIIPRQRNIQLATLTAAFPEEVSTSKGLFLPPWCSPQSEKINEEEKFAPIFDEMKQHHFNRDDAEILPKRSPLNLKKGKKTHKK